MFGSFSAGGYEKSSVVSKTDAGTMVHEKSENVEKKELETTRTDTLKKPAFLQEYQGKMNRLLEFKVCIDPGHGGIDVGGESLDGKYEKDQTLALALLVKKYLKQLGVDVFMTREQDADVGLAERREAAEAGGAQLLVSIHRNIYEGAEEVNGVEAWIHSSRPRQAEAYAKNILAAMKRLIPEVNNRGVKCGSMSNRNENYAVNQAATTSLILEVGFLSSQKDNRLFETHMEAYAEAIVRGILDTAMQTTL